MKKFDVIIAGGSASGLAAAISAKRQHPDYSVAVLEKLPRVGKKILATGNGRCNLTNINAAGSAYNAPDFVAPCFEKYGPAFVTDFFRGLGLVTYADSEGRVYPRSNAAASVLDALRYECEKSGIEIITDCPVTSAVKTADGFTVNGGYFCRYLVLACGGKSSPSQGSDGSGYDIARKLGHRITPLYPALVPLNSRPELVKSLKGIRAADVAISIVADDEEYGSSKGEILFTETGISGICAMELASCAEKLMRRGLDPYAAVDFAPFMTVNELKDYLEDTVSARLGMPQEHLLTGLFPKPLGVHFLKAAGIYRGGGEIEEMSGNMIEILAGEIKCAQFPVTGTRGFQNAQVTAGGVSRDEINPATLASKTVPGLYFCGEITDVDGPCGGYNLQWAFASGFLAGGLG